MWIPGRKTWDNVIRNNSPYLVSKVLLGFSWCLRGKACQPLKTMTMLEKGDQHAGKESLFMMFQDKPTFIYLYLDIMELPIDDTCWWPLVPCYEFNIYPNQIQHLNLVDIRFPITIPTCAIYSEFPQSCIVVYITLLIFISSGMHAHPKDFMTCLMDLWWLVLSNTTFFFKSFVWTWCMVLYPNTTPTHTGAGNP